VTLAIVDTGIDVDSPEFAGRISSASADVAGSRGIDAQDDHGTMVALVAAAARNDTGIVGIAFDATLQVLRADSPGTCATEMAGNPDSGCKFSDNAIATGINRAVAAGARVVNLSIGGSPVNRTLAQAIGAAAAAGVVVVVSAGNAGDSTDPADNPNEVDPFAATARAAGSGNVILAGSVNASGALSAFSNRAGSNAADYLAALGERVCCAYENGVLKITTNASGQRFVTLVSGTSFAAPQISGAVALLAQAFPNLSGQQIVDLLLRTARDAGAAGTDPVYGRGILDLANAFAPQGTTSLAGTGAALPLDGEVFVAGAAMGDAPAALGGAVILDGYGRAFAADFADAVRHAQPTPRLLGALSGRAQQFIAVGDAASIAVSIDGRGRVLGWAEPLRLAAWDATAARLLAGSVTARIAPDKQIGFAMGEDAEGLAMRLRGARSPAFFIAGAPGQDAGAAPVQAASFAYRQVLGVLGVTLSGERGRAWAEPLRANGDRRPMRNRDAAQRLALALDRHFGGARAGLDTSLGVSWLHEERTILGGRLHSALAGGGGADSLFLDARARWSLAPDWRLGVSWRSGWTSVSSAGQVAAGSRLRSQAFAFDLERRGVFAAGDSLAFRLAQPLRVTGGALRLSLPVDYDYATGRARFATRTVSLVPRGRELIGELAWRGPLWGGQAAASAFYRQDPGHVAALPEVIGVAVQWSAGF
jgi:hypothetical protein